LDLGVVAGLAAAVLAVLPLRAVLVPHDLDAVHLTLVDDVLILDLLVIAIGPFAAYARSITRDAVVSVKSAHEPTE
jgi:hypothetical protein